MILTESSSTGVRYQEVARLKRVREGREVSTRFGRIAVKMVRGPDGHSTFTPEYEACAQAAREKRVPLQRVYEAVLAAARAELE